MGRQPLMISYSNQKAHSEKNMERGTTSSNVKKGAWSREEDRKLTAYIGRYGIWNWNHMAKPAGLARSGKSCRLRWMNYLKPGVRHGNFTKEEEDTIIKWHHLLGNKWSIIASKLEGRTDNEIKNYWHTRIKKRIVKAVHKPPMKDDESSLAANKVVHSNIISQSLPQVVNHEETDNTTPSCDSESEFWVEDDRKSVHNGATDNTFPCTGTESVWPFDDSLLIELSDQNEVDAKFIADVFVESTSGISSEHHNIWQQLPEDLLSLNFDFGDMSMVSGRFTFPYSIHESLADESHIYDLWESL